MKPNLAIIHRPNALRTKHQLFLSEQEDAMYCPQPVDTRDIELPDSLLPLSEALARNVHEIWAQQRIADGWTYGLCKDGEAKTTPLLIPYEELDENEKTYDRNSVFETLKLITKLGYTIVPSDPER